MHLSPSITTAVLFEQTQSAMSHPRQHQDHADKTYWVFSHSRPPAQFSHAEAVVCQEPVEIKPFQQA